MTERFFDIAHDMLCLASDDGQLLQVNAAWTRTLGWSSEELCSGKMDRLIHPDDIDSTTAERARIVAGGDAVEFRNRYATRGGDWRWLEWRAGLDPETGRVFGAARDVTEQVAAQRGLEMREELLTQVIDDQLRTHDRDQRHFANELHDSVVQHLAAALMYLETAETRVGTQDENGPLHHGIRQVRASLSSARMVMQGLDPFDLGDLDLQSAIAELVDEVGMQYAVRAETDVQLEPALPAALTNVAYRVIREAFVNAGKHAQASVVRIRVRRDAHQLEIVVSDDGVGHASESPIEQGRGAGGLGLPTMRERVRAHAGDLQLETSSRGTTIRVTLPLALASA